VACEALTGLVDAINGKTFTGIVDDIAGVYCEASTLF
jgi:hypothetical protein